jgi:hydroxymethylpyrimidine pyrophosphatase-like HAD family hydrolase
MSEEHGKTITIWFMDFDGTVKPLGKNVSPEDLDALQAIGEAGGVRAVATGRSIRTFEADWEPGFEIDYLISSAGLALSRWGKGGLVETEEIRSFSPEDAELAVKTAVGLGVGFAFCFPPPRTHAFYYQLPPFPAPPSFHAMITQADREPHPWKGEAGFGLGQIILIGETGLVREKAEVFKKAMPWLSYAFTRSPYLDGALWLEVYPPGVSKGQAAARLSARLGFSAQEAAALGNDYNDADLLDWAGTSYISAGGPADMLPAHNKMPPAGSAPLKYVLQRELPGVYEDFLLRKGA